MARSKMQEKHTKIKAKLVNSSSADTTKNLSLSINSIIAAICIAIAVWFGVKGYLETRVNTPYNVEKVCKLLQIQSQLYNVLN